MGHPLNHRSCRRPALPPVRAVAGDQSKVVQLRALRMLLGNIADRASNMDVKMAAKLLLTHPGSRTKTLRVREAAEVPGAKTSERSVRRNQGELLSAFLNALLEFLDDPTAVRIFEREARKSLRLSSEASPRSAPRAYYVHREEFERRFKKLVSDGAKLIVRIRKCCERALRWPAWRSSSAAPVMALRVRVSYPGGGGCAQVRRSSGLAFQGRNRSSAFPLSGFPPLRPHSSR